MITMPAPLKKKIQQRKIKCGYLMQDCIYLWEEIHYKAGKLEKTGDFWHIIRSDDGHGFHMYSYQSNAPRICRMVFHTPAMLIDGIQEARVYFNGKSEASDKQGIPGFTTVRVITVSGIEFCDTSIPGVYGGDIAVQPNPDDRFSTTYHGAETADQFIEQLTREGEPFQVYNVPTNK